MCFLFVIWRTFCVLIPLSHQIKLKLKYSRNCHLPPLLSEQLMDYRKLRALALNRVLIGARSFWKKQTCFFNLCLNYFRGGILEPAGTCEIRFKQKDLLKTMKRLDEKYAKLTQDVSDPGWCFLFKAMFLLRTSYSSVTCHMRCD